MRHGGEAAEGFRAKRDGGPKSFARRALISGLIPGYVDPNPIALKKGARRLRPSPDVSASPAVIAMMIEVPPRIRAGIVGVGRPNDAAIAVAGIGRCVT